MKRTPPKMPKGRCINDCKKCSQSYLEFAEDQRGNIVFDIVCNKYGNIAESYQELLQLKKEAQPDAV